MRPMPKRRAVIPYRRRFAPRELARLTFGLVPESMDDKWVGVLREGCVDFFRSWTGHHIYCLPLRSVDGGIETEAIIASRDPRQYRNRDPERDIETVERLLNWMLTGDPG